MDDPIDLALGIVTGVSLALCFGCVIVHIIRETRRRPLKHSRSDTNLALNVDTPVVVHRDSDPAVEF
jgi:hypothetical protein